MRHPPTPTSTQADQPLTEDEWLAADLAIHDDNWDMVGMGDIAVALVQLGYEIVKVKPASI